MKPTFDKKRPLSWSAISSFEYNKEDWYKKYVLKKPQHETEEMIFGKKVGEKLASDPKFLPAVPRLSVFEQSFSVVFDGIPLIGYADSFCGKTKKKLNEYKTGVKAWTQQRADEHGQIDMYLLMNYITNKVRPEDVEVKLVWLPTQRKENGDFSVKISLVKPIEPQIFPTKRTMADVLTFGMRLRKVFNEMDEYAKNHA